MDEPTQLPVLEPQAAPPTGPITLQLTRTDHPTAAIQRLWIVVDSIIAVHPSNPGTPPGTVIWVAPQQAFLVSETVDQVLYLMGARVQRLTSAERASAEDRATLKGT